jgi:hypothetical protein
MKIFLMVLVLITFLVMLSLPCLALVGGENYVWVSEDLGVNYSKIGYFHQEQKFIKVTSETSRGGLRSSFDLSFGSDILSFEDSSGLYGEVGVNSSTMFNLMFGTGFKYATPNANLMLTIGAKCYLQQKKFVYEALAFIRILPPLVLNLSYDDLNGSKLFVGLGLKFE